MNGDETSIHTGSVDILGRLLVDDGVEAHSRLETVDDTASGGSEADARRRNQNLVIGWRIDGDVQQVLTLVVRVEIVDAGVRRLEEGFLRTAGAFGCKIVRKCAA